MLLSLQAWWCEPCHQMNTITYDDPQVRELIADRFIPVYVDQDSRPDISQRYERWGWPATIIFGADGTEIVADGGGDPARVPVALASRSGLTLIRDHRPAAERPAPSEACELIVESELARTALVDPRHLEDPPAPGEERRADCAVVCAVATAAPRLDPRVIDGLAACGPELILAGASPASALAVVAGDRLTSALRDLHERFVEREVVR